jgi:hypothetical protein
MKKRFSAVLAAMLFNLVVCVSVAMATGFSPVTLAIGGTIIGGVSGGGGGTLNMAIQKEIWMNHIVEGLFADNSFLSKAYSADMFVNAGRTVHIPNAGSPSNVERNRVEKPATVHQRTDTDLTFNLDEFTSDPIYIPHADTVELSYNKRESVLKQDKAKLQEAVANAMLFKWSPAAANTIKTTGLFGAAHLPSATGNRKLFRKSDVNAAMVKFNADDVPQEGRYLLIDAIMYSQLLDDLTQIESQAFFSQADVKNGIIGKLYSFNIMMRSKALRYTGGTVAKDWKTAGAATDNAAALAWHIDSVVRAVGEINFFEDEGNPLYYGDIYSFLIRCGGRPMRSDVKGLLAIVQDTAA